ncbi:MAG TPA: isoprenylcysteine carboxylmethyltransferase family protein [Terriglobales bacterium]|nr:isoprenylcysteine carboxylmethyltransferase family protein [Terriglobales bacterium]
MTLNIQTAVELPWLALAGFWLVTSFAAKTPVRRQPGISRMIHLLFMVAAFGLLFRPDMRVGPLGWRVLPVSPAIAYPGVALTIAGAAFAFWARAMLGGNWSASVTVKENHSLVRSGPYRLVRHPIYTGCLIAMLGTAMVFGELGCFIALAIAIVAFWLKTRTEEDFMTAQFGEDYIRYRSQVRRLVPFLL